MTLYKMDGNNNNDSDIVEKLEITIDRLNREDALDILYEIKRLLK